MCVVVNGTYDYNYNPICNHKTKVFGVGFYIPIHFFFLNLIKFSPIFIINCLLVLPTNYRPFTHWQHPTYMGLPTYYLLTTYLPIITSYKLVMNFTYHVVMMTCMYCNNLVLFHLNCLVFYDDNVRLILDANITSTTQMKIVMFPFGNTLQNY